MKFNSFLNHQKYNRQRPCLRADAKAMGNKGNVVLYLDRELVAKSKALGFNLSKTFENHLKHLITQYSTCNLANNVDSTRENARANILLANEVFPFIS
jgi:post-segregation antitoxin (ccd killing protein)